MPRLTLPFPPSVNHYWRNVVMPSGPTCPVCGVHRKHSARTLISKDGREYRERAHAKLQDVAVQTGPVSVYADIYRPRRVGDLDNYTKALLDALTGFAYMDDSQVARLHLERFDDKANPRAELLIEPYAPRNPATLLF